MRMTCNCNNKVVAKRPCELSLDEMLEDEIVRLVMRSDDVSEAALRDLMRRVGGLTAPFLGES